MVVVWCGCGAGGSLGVGGGGSRALRVLSMFTWCRLPEAVRVLSERSALRSVVTSRMSGVR